MSMMSDLKDVFADKPYVVRCSTCSKELESNTTVDHDLDMIVVVEPCECQTKREDQ